MIEINTQDIPVEELVNLVKPQLAKIIKLCQSKVIANNRTLHIYETLTNKFDVELDEDFDRNVFMYFEPSEVNAELENDGWFDNDLNESYAKLLEGWNWDAVRLTDGRSVIITEDESDEGDIVIHIVDENNIVDGAIESKYWLGVSINPTQ